MDVTVPVEPLTVGCDQKPDNPQALPIDTVLLKEFWFKVGSDDIHSIRSPTVAVSVNVPSNKPFPTVDEIPDGYDREDLKLRVEPTPLDDPIPKPEVGAESPIPSPANWGVEDVAIACGKDNVTAPVDADAITSFEVPVIDDTTLDDVRRVPLVGKVTEVFALNVALNV